MRSINRTNASYRFISWCGPCKILGPRLESILADNKKVHLAKINVDDNDLLAEKYEVSAAVQV